MEKPIKIGADSPIKNKDGSAQKEKFKFIKVPLEVLGAVTAFFMLWLGYQEWVVKKAES